MLTMSGCVSNPIKTSHGRSEVLAELLKFTCYSAPGTECTTTALLTYVHMHTTHNNVEVDSELKPSISLSPARHGLSQDTSSPHGHVLTCPTGLAE